MNSIAPLTVDHVRDEGRREKIAQYPERILQIGEGNFMRGFIDWMIFMLNNNTNFKGRVVAIQPTPRGKVVPKLNRQNGLYTLIRRGVENGEPVQREDMIDSISRGINPYTDWQDILEVATSEHIEFLFSNTTEAGLAYEKEEYMEGKSPLSFPGKVVALLYHRFKHFDGASDKGWTILPCELVENNGIVLRGICNQIIEDWHLPRSFSEWLNESCAFCNTLVDRIVPGYPNDEADKWFEKLRYTDELLTIAEPYHLFVIDGPSNLSDRIPFVEAGLNVRFEPVATSRDMKVKLLNAPHTMMAVIGLQLGIETVKEAMEDPLLGKFIRTVMKDEIVSVFPEDKQLQAVSYIDDVLDRFSNPFLEHRLQDISLNSFAKFQVRVRPLIETGGVKKSEKLVFSLAALITLYQACEIKDDEKVLLAFNQVHQHDGMNQEVLKDFIETEMLSEWQLEKVEISKIVQAVTDDVMLIQKVGMREALASKWK